MRKHGTTNEVDQPPTYKVKLSGDGAKMTRLTAFVIISFSLLNDEDAVMSSKGKLCHQLKSARIFIIINSFIFHCF